MLGHLLSVEGKQHEMLTQQISLASFELVNPVQQLLVRVIDKHNILTSFLNVRCAEAQLLEETGAEKNILGIRKTSSFEPVAGSASHRLIQLLIPSSFAGSAVAQITQLRKKASAIDSSIDDLQVTLQYRGVRYNTNVRLIALLACLFSVCSDFWQRIKLVIGQSRQTLFGDAQLECEVAECEVKRLIVTRNRAVYVQENAHAFLQSCDPFSSIAYLSTRRYRRTIPACVSFLLGARDDGSCDDDYFFLSSLSGLIAGSLSGVTCNSSSARGSFIDSSSSSMSSFSLSRSDLSLSGS